MCFSRAVQVPESWLFLNYPCFILPSLLSSCFCDKFECSLLYLGLSFPCELKEGGAFSISLGHPAMALDTPTELVSRNCITHESACDMPRPERTSDCILPVEEIAVYECRESCAVCGHSASVLGHCVPVLASDEACAGYRGSVLSLGDCFHSGALAL